MIESRPETLNHHLSASAAQRPSEVRFLESSGEVVETSWREIHEGASRCAAALQSRGVGRGDRVAVLGATSRRVVETIFGILLCGGTVVVLPLPLRVSHPERFWATTLAMVETAGARLLLVDAQHAELCGARDPAAAGGPILLQLEDLCPPGPGPALIELPEVSSADLAVLQFTSGSTRRPKAVCLSHGQICSNLFAMADVLRLTPKDGWVSWLPLYHDMGLISGLFLPMSEAMAATLMPAQAFILEPALWMRSVSQHRSTVTVAPNFAYSLAARALRRGEGLDLSSLRVALCGAEPIVPQDLHAFVEAGRRFGLDPHVMVPCYGLAEASLAVTFAPLGRPVVADPVDERALAPGGAVPRVSPLQAKKRVVSVGRPLRGITVQVVDDAGRAVPERVVGEVQIASCSLMRGYEGLDADAGAIRDGWLATGDLGYLAGGELYICGRKKQIIKIHGRTIWPEDVEHIAQEVPGVRRGNACAFGVVDERGHEVLIVVAEVGKGVAECAALPGEVLSAVADHLEVTPRHVVVLAPGSLPKTTSGKLARNRARDLYLQGELPIRAEAGLRVRP